MHRIAATPGGWNPQAEGVIFIEQTPAPIVFLTAADTDIQTLAVSRSKLPINFPEIRVVNLLQLQQQLTIDTYAENVLAEAQVIIVRLLGGRSYWSYGLEVIRETVENSCLSSSHPQLTGGETKEVDLVSGGTHRGASLIVLPGDDRPDPDLISHSTVSLGVVNQVWRYFTEGGVDNFVNALQFIADVCLGQNYNPPPPQVVPRVGLYSWQIAPPHPGLPKGENFQQPTTNNRFHARSAVPQITNHKQPTTNNQPQTTNNQQTTTNKQPQTSNHKQPFSCPKGCTTTNKVGILFYRAHYLAGNTSPIDALCQALAQRNLEAVAVFVSSLRENDVQEELLQYFQPTDDSGIGVLLNTTSFSLAKLETDTPQLEFWTCLDVPVLQVILSGGTQELWDEQSQGLTPRDTAMNVVLPEVDGRIITRAVSFKSVQTRNPDLQTDVVVYEPVSDRIQFVADLAANWVKLRQTPPSQRKIALILANYPNRDGRLANGVGLDTPASCIEILKALQQAGYQVEDIPETGDILIQRLTTGVTNDPEGRELRTVQQQLSYQEYQDYFATLPTAVQQGILHRWGDGEAGGEILPNPHSPFPIPHSQFPIPGIQLGNVFVGIQPSRGYDLDPSLNYHAPDLEPTHTYLAFYYWLRQHFNAHAVVHVGKHGNLEWLPGKSLALSENCYPEVAFGAMPHLYPFIVNDPGEGSQAKRRSQAVIIDHLTPPMTRAELYGPLQQLEGLIDEYYEAQSLDPTRLPVINERIIKLIVQEKLYQDLGIDKADIQNHKSEINTRIDGYLCELKEAQIRDGLHIFGQCPQGRQLRDLIVAIARHPGKNRLGLTRALAKDQGWDFDPLTTDLSIVLNQSSVVNGKTCHTIGDLVEVLEQQAAELVQQLIATDNSFHARSGGARPCAPTVQQTTNYGQHTQQELSWIDNCLLTSLLQTNQELSQLLRGLDGKYVPSGPSGAPTRGRPEVLPTGRNFYSVDIRAIPTETAWDVGRKAAEVLIERYTQENGEYPKTLGLSVWGTSTMRTGGDDIAEALALLGVQPVWDYPSRRVVDFEILPVSILGRPRVDVTLRISGFFRDAFPNLIDLFDQAVIAIAALEESAEENPLASLFKQEKEQWETIGLSKQEAEARSRYRIFGSKPGAYGAGLQGLIEAQNWTSEQDLARAYINWSSYAYTSTPPIPPQESENTPLVSPLSKESLPPIPPLTKERLGKESLPPIPPLTQGGLGGVLAPEAFEKRLQQMQIVLHNQDNREHDLLDSDDYYQFQGGLTVAIRALTGKNPQTYFGDNSIPENPKVRQLREEIARVYRSRVVNPKWIAGVMRHGYKGAFEMSATVDYLFAYDATANCVEDHMYQGVAEAYLFNPIVQEFIQEKNPWALRDMSERLLEAHQRGLWKEVDKKILEDLRLLVHQAEAVIEGKIAND